MKNVQFYSLQVNPTMNNYKNYDLITLGEGFKNFDDTAGAVSNLDLVITVDTSVAHLAGGLGIKTFMLLPYCPDWRWFDNDKKSEWYNSLTIFKQTNPQSWDEPVNDIATELAKMIKEK
jgi:ADP-heptose:LPS heptosyltransferase